MPRQLPVQTGYLDIQKLVTLAFNKYLHCASMNIHSRRTPCAIETLLFGSGESVVACVDPVHGGIMISPSNVPLALHLCTLIEC
jgi:hypothetical protein